MNEALTLELSGPEAVPGGRVEGTITPGLTASDRAGRVLVALERSGRRTDESLVTEQVLHEGVLARGASFPFTLALPEGAPLSFEGEEVSTRWRVLARLEVAWALDPAVAAPLRVVARPLAPGEDAEAARAPDSDGTYPAPAWLNVLLWLFLGLGFVLFSPILLPLWALRWLRRRLSGRYVRDLRLVLDGRALLVGDPLRVGVTLRVLRPIPVTRLAVRLVRIEHWWEGPPEDRSHRERAVVVDEQLVLEAVRLVPTGPGACELRAEAWLSHPPGEPASGSNLSWRVDAALELPGLPDLAASSAVEVRAIAAPPGEGRPASNPPAGLTLEPLT